MKLTPTGNYYGTHGAQTYMSETKVMYLVKKQEMFRNLLDKAISVIAKKSTLQTPDVFITRIDDQSVAVHSWIPGSDAFPDSFDVVKLKAMDILDLQFEMVFDYMIGNYDSHPGNFIRRSNHLRQIIGIDKGQAFRYWGADSPLDPDYHPNKVYGEREPVYNSMIRAAKDGLIKMKSFYDYELRYFIEDLENISNSWYQDILSPYAEEAARVGCLATGSSTCKNNPQAFLDEAVVRKATIRDAFSELDKLTSPPKVTMVG